MSHRLRRIISILAVIAFIVGAVAAFIAGNWSGVVLALVGVAVVLLWSQPAR